MEDAAHPNLFAFMDAYNVLEVDYSADSLQVRRAYKRLARLHHPDKHPSGSPEHQQATARMAKINDGYRLVREAPLRYHRMSRASDPDTPWRDSELDEAIRRAHAARYVDLAMTIGSIVVAVVIVPLFVSALMPAVSKSGPLQFPFVVLLTLGSSLLMWMVLGPRMWHTLITIQLALGGLQVLASLW